MDDLKDTIEMSKKIINERKRKEAESMKDKA
jgi:hypothetical protein